MAVPVELAPRGGAQKIHGWKTGSKISIERAGSRGMGGEQSSPEEAQRPADNYDTLPIKELKAKLAELGVPEDLVKKCREKSELVELLRDHNPPPPPQPAAAEQSSPFACLVECISPTGYDEPETIIKARGTALLDKLAIGDEEEDDQDDAEEVFEEVVQRTASRRASLKKAASSREMESVTATGLGGGVSPSTGYHRRILL